MNENSTSPLTNWNDPPPFEPSPTQAKVLKSLLSGCKLYRNIGYLGKGSVSIHREGFALKPIFPKTACKDLFKRQLVLEVRRAYPYVVYELSDSGKELAEKLK